MHNVVVATGGGSVLSEANRAAMRRKGFIVCFDARPETIAARIQDSTVGHLRAAAACRRQPAGDDHRAEVGTRSDLRAGRLHHPDRRFDAGPGDAPGAAGVPRALGGGRGHSVIRVTAEKHAYDIHCRWGALDDLGALMRDAGLRGSAFVVSDDAVGPLFGERALASLRAAGFDAAIFAFPGGRGEQEPRDGAVGLRLAAGSARGAFVDRRDAGRRRRGRPRRLRRGDVPARRQLRAGADVAAGDGRCVDRRQGGRRPSTRQEPDRRVLPAEARRAGHEPAGVAAATLAPRGICGSDQARADHGCADAGRAGARRGAAACRGAGADDGDRRAERRAEGRASSAKTSARAGAA